MNVTILICEQLSLFELGCAAELFALPREEFACWYKTKIVTLKGGQFGSLGNLQIGCEVVEYLPESDLLVIPSFPVGIKTIDSHLRSEVINHYQKGGRIISFCSGSFLLAALGLLNQRKAITHWRYAAEFKQRFPHISYSDDGLYEFDGTIGCSAGSAAAIDLGIEVIRQDFGYEYANTVARRLVLPAHRDGGQSQFVEKPLSRPNTALSKTLDWAVKNLTPTLTIEQIASNANMTRRTFDRHIMRQYKMTAHQWLNERKLEIAKRLLETTNLNLEQIAHKSAFDNAITLRHNFNKSLSVTPTQYRQTFKSSSLSA